MRLASETISARRLGQWSVIALGASIPISTALDNVLLVLVVGCFLVSAMSSRKLSLVNSNPVISAAIILFTLLALGTLYGHGNFAEAAKVLMKYVDLLLVPVFAFFFFDRSARRHALYALAASLALTVMLSFSLAGGILVRPEFFVYDPLHAVPFKFTLTHTIFVSFGAFLFIQFAANSTSSKARWFWAALAGLAIVNIFFVVSGRTGVVVLGALILYCGYARWGWAGMIRTLMLLMLFSIIAHSIPGVFQDRINQAIYEYSSWAPATLAKEGDSIGTRLEFYRNTLAIVREHPVFGVGTGGFPAAYAAQVQGSNMPATQNPHNEYLLIASQIGLVGLVALLYLFCQQWRLAPRLALPLERHLARGLVIMISIGCLFNSMLLDHAEGLFFAWLTGLLFSELGSVSNQDPVRTE